MPFGNTVLILHIMLEKDRNKSQRNTVSVLWVHKSKSTDMQGQKFESSSIIIYAHKRINFNFTVFRIWAKHAAAEANIWGTKIALTKNILLVAPLHKFKGNGLTM